MFGRCKALMRPFVQGNFHEKLETLKPIISSNVPHKDFTSVFIYSSLPIFIGGLSSVVFPSFDLFSQIVPNIVLNTMIYASLHTTLLAGAHFGFASVLYDEQNDSLESRSLRTQLAYPFFAPIFATFMSCCYWAFPYTHLKSLYTISGIGFVYIGVFVGDSFFADKVKVVPVWYRNLKRKVTIVALVGISLLLVGVYKFPEETKLKNFDFPIKIVKVNQ